MARDEAYLKAEKKIEETRQSGAKELKLNGMELTELPKSLGQLTQLQSLYLINNKLTVLPKLLSNLTQLQVLYLSKNQLQVLPEWFSQLTLLQVLDLGTNQLTTLPHWFGKLNCLRILNLAFNQLRELPESLSSLTQLYGLSLGYNQLQLIPESLCMLTELCQLGLGNNQLTAVPSWFGNFIQLEKLTLFTNNLTVIPESIGQLTRLQLLSLAKNSLATLPPSIAQLEHLKILDLEKNNITDLPSSLAKLEHLRELNLLDNPLNPELAEAYKQGLDAVKAYLRAKATAQITLDEAKLILVGEGEVGKTCLMDALLGNLWQEHDTTHGIEIKKIKVMEPYIKKEITLNGWDFGGQRVYRPTHQLFFSAPAVYLVVWKPREGPQQGFVKEWIKLIKHREPSAKIIVVATHGGPQMRQPDIDRQELWDLFGKETVVDFFFVDSKPDENGNRKGIDNLKLAIACIAATLPEVGRSVPKSFQDVRVALQKKGVPYLPLDTVLDICRAHKMDDEIARLFITISHRLGHLTHYENDPTLRDIVILRPDWLATAMSYALDDEITRSAHGLVKFSRLGQLWDDPTRAVDLRYPATLHPIFLRLMERFDISYRVADPSAKSDADPLSLIGQLVPDNRPNNMANIWPKTLSVGDLQQTQICHIVDTQNGQSASAEGLFYQLIVRLHKYSLGRVDYNASVHWQRGLVLDNDYNGHALLEYKGNDVHITARAPYPERFLAMLTGEVKYLVESFWEGLRCDVMVPCANPCGKDAPGTGMFEVEKLFAFRRQGMIKFPCMVSGCNQIQDIDCLLRNAPVATAVAAEALFFEFTEVKRGLAAIYQKMKSGQAQSIERFDQLDANDQRLLSRVDEAFEGLLRALSDEAKEGPRLFSLVPVKRSGFNPKQWVSEKFRLILWCEHSRLPLPILNGKNSQKGIYELELTREWFKKSAPLLKLMTNALSLALPIAASGAKLVIDQAVYDFLEDYFNFGKEVIDATLSASDKVGLWTDTGDSVSLPHGAAIRAENATLREFHTLLKAKDPGLGGLVRVMNKRNEFLWVHERFAEEY